MALVTSYNHQKELNLGASESMSFVDQLNFHSQPLNRSSILGLTPFLRLKSSPLNYVEQCLVYHMDNILQGVQIGFKLAHKFTIINFL
jgi:hypothetical protein